MKKLCRILGIKTRKERRIEYIRQQNEMMRQITEGSIISRNTGGMR